jgi:hypothetical protein
MKGGHVRAVWGLVTPCSVFPNLGRNQTLLPSLVFCRLPYDGVDGRRTTKPS